MAGRTVSRTAHFVLHRAALTAAPVGDPARHSVGQGDNGTLTPAQRPLFPIKDDPWIGAVVPKRWAKRAVTRNGIKRQIYSVSASFASRLPAAAHVVRLRMDFARAEFPSAWSEPLKQAVRGELLQLFGKAAQRVVPAPAGTGGEG